MRLFVLPLIYLFFSATSLLVLTSLAPALVSKQLTAILIGAGIFWVLSKTATATLYFHPRILYLVAMISLAVALVLPTAKSTHRWIDLPFFSIQPSQFAFALIALAISAWLVTHSIKSKTTVIKLIAAILLPTILIFLEPNFGTSILFIGVMLSLLFWAGLPIKYVAIGILLLGFTTVGLWSFWLKDYQKSRLTGFIHTADQSPAAYNAQQAIIAIGAGGVLGQGFGQGYQSQLQFLPEKHTDFIFASTAEEFGLVGSLVVLLGYVLLIGTLLSFSAQVSNPQRLFILATATLLLLQITLHVGANVRLLPITGVPLPLLSYGGSSVVSFAAMLGICQQAIATIHTKTPIFIH